MSPKDPIERITTTIDREKAALAGLFVRQPGQGLDHRVACFELTRAVDFGMWQADRTRSNEAAGRAATLFRGFNDALALYLDDDSELPGVPNAPSDDRSCQWADGVLLRLSLLGEAQRAVDLHKAGLITCVANNPKIIVFEPASETGWLELRDVEAGRWMSALAVSQDQDEYKDLRGRWPAIRQLLRKKVHRFADAYMGYDAHPELDDYYQRLAVLHARRNVGHDAFEPTAMFGDLPFEAYAATAVQLVGFAYKHMHFATEAIELFPDLRPRNLVTTWTPLEKKAEFVAGALDCQHAEAVQLLKPFVATRDAVAALAKVNDGPVPFFIPIGRGYCASSIAAQIVSPYGLLLRRLKAEFESDWFSNVDAREAMFREHLRWMVPIKRVYFAEKPVVLRRGSQTATDLDAVVLVKETGTLGIFQLKWQDPFGPDLRERRSRMSNLVASANRWVETVLKWIEVNGLDALLRCCGFPAETLGCINQVRLFVLGRYHVGFSGSVPPDQRAAWSTWPELIRLIDERGSVRDPILVLFEDMKAAELRARRNIPGGVDRIPLRDFAIELRTQGCTTEGAHRAEPMS